MKRLLLYGLTLLVLAGCAPTRWSWQHPDDPGQEQLAQDLQKCETILHEEMTYSYPDYGYRHHYRYNRPWPHYAYAPYWRHYDYWPYGYGWYDDPFVYQRYRDELFRVCMRAQDWRQVPVEEE